MGNKPSSTASAVSDATSVSMASTSFHGSIMPTATTTYTQIATMTSLLSSSAANTGPTTPITLITISSTSSSPSSPSLTSLSTWTGAPPTISVALPSSTGAPQYIFVYGDSYSHTSFDIAGTKPILGDPMGNPSFPGIDSTGVNQSNWVDILTSNSPLNTLTYDFAQPGAVVDNPTIGPGRTTPDFSNQSIVWLTNLATSPPPAYAQWTAANSVHLLWFGRNDMFFQIQQNVSLVGRVNNVTTLYIKTLEKLRAAGARRFVIMGMPPMWREPAWGLPDPWHTWQPQAQPASQQWNTVLQSKVAAWKKGKPNVKMTWLDTWTAFSRVLDNPAPWNVVNATCTNDVVGAQGNCAWADVIHPGPPTAKSIGIAVGQHLLSIGFLSGFGLK